MNNFKFDNFIVCDIEGDGLLNTATRIYCLSYQTEEMYFKDEPPKTIFEGIPEFLEEHSKDYHLVMHHGVGYDLPVLEKLYGMKDLKERCIDTLWISRQLQPTRKSHSLESWGKTYGIPKVEIEYWVPQEGQSYDDFLKDMELRCSVDVKINMALWLDLKGALVSLYKTAGIT